MILMGLIPILESFKDMLISAGAMLPKHVLRPIEEATHVHFCANKKTIKERSYKLTLTRTLAERPIADVGLSRQFLAIF